jgi:hypothetical protein
MIVRYRAANPICTGPSFFTAEAGDPLIGANFSSVTG